MKSKVLLSSLVLLTLGLTLFATPVRGADTYLANIKADGTITLTNGEAHEVNVHTEFMAMVPREISAGGTYTATFQGQANVTLEMEYKYAFSFEGNLTINEYTFPVEFTIYKSFGVSYTGVYTAIGSLTVTIMPISAEGATWVMMHGYINSYGDLPAFGWCGVYAKIGEWAQAFAAWMPGTPTIPETSPETINFYAARLVNTTLVELNYSGADLYIEGLWNVYNVTFIYEPGVVPGNYTFKVELLVDHGEGNLRVTDNWKNFAITITGIDEIKGTVIHYCVRQVEVIPMGDVSSSSGPGIPDYKVDIWDLVHAAKAYGSTPVMMNLDFSMDFNFDFKIDIYDLTTIAVNIGESY